MNLKRGLLVFSMLAGLVSFSLSAQEAGDTSPPEKDQSPFPERRPNQGHTAVSRRSIRSIIRAKTSRPGMIFLKRTISNLMA